MRRNIIIVALLLLASLACQKPASQPYAPPDPAADKAAYHALLPAADAPPVDEETIPMRHRAAFNFAGIHFRNAMGWWYFNAHAVDERGRRWAFMFAILSDNQFYGSVSLPDDDIFIPLYRKVPTVVDRLGLSAASEGIAQLRQTERGRLRFAFRLTDPSARLDLTLTALGPPIPVSGDGKITMGGTGKSKYFFIPSLRVTGTAAAGGIDTKLTGLGWMDHQWGLWNYGKIKSWHWHSAHLTDGTKLMAFGFRTKDRPLHVDCDVILPGGEHKANVACSMKPLSQWKSAATGRRWTSVWQIDAPELDLSLTLTADRENQEINETIYEGGCYVAGTRGGKAVTGRAFYEESQL